MQNHKRGVVVFIAVILLMFALYFYGFGGGPVGRYLQYQHPNLGFVLPVPEDWTLQEEAADMAAWQSPKDDFALLVMGQLGGYSYYDSRGMANIMGSLLQGSISQWQELSRERRPDLPKCYRIIGQGVDGEGNTVVTDGLILEPMQAVRFYLIGISGPEQYQKYKGTLEDIYDGFDVVLSTDELYARMMDMKAAAEEEEADKAAPKLPEPVDNTEDGDL